MVTTHSSISSENSGRPDLILFDWDNTLADNWQLVIDALNHARERFGHERWSNEEADRKISLSARELFPQIFGADHEAAQKAFYDYFETNHLKVLKPMPDVVSLLEGLKSRDVPLGLISNKRGDLLRKEVAHLGLDAYFQTIIGAGDAKKDKPHAEVVSHAISEIGLELNTQKNIIWYVGDSQTDIDTAKNSKMQPIIILGARATIEEINKKKMEKILFFNGLTEFYSYSCKIL